MKKIERKVRPMTLAEFEAKFPDEEACKTYLATIRWPDGPTCPRCFNRELYELNTRPYHWQCHKCQESGYRFSVLVGTIFENTNYPLKVWFKVMYFMLSSKKSMSALQIQRMMGMGSYHTAHKMCMKIRVAMGNEDFRQLTGFVEVDETFVGGKAKNRHKDKRGGPGGGTGSHGGTGSVGKSIVVGALQRKGNVIARVVHGLDAKTLCGFVREAVSHNVSLLCTDERRGYVGLRKDYNVGSVDHWHGQYVHGAIHTQSIEGFWSLVKRAIIGTFHNVSAKYLPLYVNEFQFRYNNRGNADIFAAAIKAC